MTEQEIVELGDYCEQVLTHPAFNEVVRLFEISVVQAMLSTKPPEDDERDRLYNQMIGSRELLLFFQEFVVQRHKLIDEKPPADTTDDPRVHDIYDDGID